MTANLSSLDGFFSDVKEEVDEMIKYLANEPSVGLFFVQQHAQTSMPYLLNFKEKVGEKVHEVTLHTEDLEDSIGVVRSMTEYGFPIADEMIKEINRSLLIMSTAQPKRGLIINPSWSFQVGRSSGSPQFNQGIMSAQKGEVSGRGYLSSVFNTAKQKAAELRWPQQTTVLKSPKSDQSMTPSSLTPLASIPPEGEIDELPVSSQVSGDQLDGDLVTDSFKSQDMSSLLENFDKFKSEREAKLEEWLQGMEPRQVHH